MRNLKYLMNPWQRKVWQNTKCLIYSSDEPWFFLKNFSLHSLGGSWREHQALGKDLSKENSGPFRYRRANTYFRQ